MPVRMLPTVHNPGAARMRELAGVRFGPPKRKRSKTPCVRTPWPWPCSICASNYGCSHRESGLLEWIAREYKWRARLPHPKQDTRDWLDGIKALYSGPHLQHSNENGRNRQL